IDTFRIDIFPQFLKPIVQQIANKNFFTGAPIETMSEQKREAAERFSVRTSDFSKAVGGILGKHIEQVSPKRIDAFVNDMFAGTGRMGLEIMDRVVMPWITSYPEDPATRIGDRYITGLGRFVKGTAAPYRTRSEEDFYELIKEADKANSTLNHYKKLGEMEKGRAYIEKKVDVLSKHKRLRRVQKKISKINQRIRLIGLSKTLSADQKRKEIDELLEMRNDIFHMVMTRVKEMEKE
ncbi:hypothetical protein KAR91_30155, partial [Candidatus Pacearchaeota archaeon]|nr:hypothetical protein [Candidatus Pacearchaeota archaeon]